MKTHTPALALILALAVGGAASAQAAKGNAPIKQRHTVNDGSSRPAANSFTEGEARQHIMHSGYSDVSALTKGDDGVWRGTATKDGTSRPVELDFKGNVSDQGAAAEARPAAVDASRTGNGARP
jgi:hypothetical protein